MSASQHTRPWKAVDCRHQKNGQIRIWGDGHIANTLASHPQCEGNAYLIAAAPELYEAGCNLRNQVRGVITVFEHALRDVIGNTNFNCIAQALMDADNAIAKAEGR